MKGCEMTANRSDHEPEAAPDRAPLATSPEEKARQLLISALLRFDPNGCYTDEECDAEGMPRLTLLEAALRYCDFCDEAEGPRPVAITWLDRRQMYARSMGYEVEL